MKGSGNIPKSSGNIPEGSGNIPKGSGNIPEGSGSIPEGLGSIPKSSGSIPEGLGNIPKSSGRSPHRRKFFKRKDLVELDSSLDALKNSEPSIREIGEEAELMVSVAVIREAFATVARDFNLTAANAPTNPAFIQRDGLKALQEKGLHLFGCFVKGRQVGFIAIEKAPGTHDPELYYLEKVAVLPEQRHHGIGTKLLDFGCAFVRARGGRKISIALINENEILKQWYRAYGFRETGLKHFEHLSFTVCFMEKLLEA